MDAAASKRATNVITTFKQLWLDMVQDLLETLSTAFPECSGCSQCKTLFGSFVKNNEKLKSMIIDAWALEVTPYCAALLNAKKTTDERIHELLEELRVSADASDRAANAPQSIGKITRVLMFGTDAEKQSMLQKLTKPLTWLTMLDIETKWRDPLLTDESKEYLVQYLNKINGYALLHKIVPESLVPMVMKYQGELVNRIAKMPMGQNGTADRVRVSNELVHVMFNMGSIGGGGGGSDDGEPDVPLPGESSFPEMLSFITKNIKGMHLATECLSYPNCLGIMEPAALEQTGRQAATSGGKAADASTSPTEGIAALASMLPPGVSDMVSANADKMLNIDPEFLVSSMKGIIVDILGDDVSAAEKEKIDRILGHITPGETHELIKMLFSGNLTACMDHALLKKMMGTFHASELDLKGLLSKISIDKILTKMVSFQGTGAGSDPMVSSIVTMATSMIKGQVGDAATLGDISPEMMQSLAASVISGGGSGVVGGAMGSAAASAMVAGMLGGGGGDGRPSATDPYGVEAHDENFE